MLDDDDLAERLLDSRVVFRSRRDREDEEAGTTVWHATFEGHLVAVIVEEATGHSMLIVDGEPSGELTGWPPGWERS